MSPVRSIVRAHVAVLVVAGALAVPAATAAAHADDASSPWVGPTAPVDTRAGQVLAQMTLDEKITMVHGAAGCTFSPRLFAEHCHGA
jgi:beta-glucosidase